ncbi:MAG: acetate--CoA ligase family protein [Acidobacteria bacterium]|nr:acetate--CoA ligase family protein [Acidobacteriota bacterium]
MKNSARHSLDALLRPASVAVIGASNDPTRIGGRPVRYLRAGGYGGRIYPVNPRHPRVQGLPAFAGIAEVPEAPDLAIVAVPAPSVLATVEACAARGVRAAVVFSAGFAEMGAEGRRAQDRLGEVASSTGMRIVGPNCLGVYNSELGAYATFSTTLEDGYPTPGGVALVSQSGAYGSHLSLLARKRNIDIRYWVTTGNEADVTVPEVLGWMAEQDDVSVIMAHAEGITDPDALLRALRVARARGKPVVFQKVGVTEVGARAAQSHTASLAGADPVYEAAFRQFGAYRARDTDEVLDIAYAARFGLFPATPRVALVSISGGVGVQMADAAVGFGLDVAPLSDAAQARLKSALPYASPRNPVDITAQAFNQVDLIGDNLGIVIEERQHDAVVAFFTYVAAADGMVEPVRRAIEAAHARRPECPLVLSIVAPPDVVRQYEAVGCPVFEDPTRAVRAVAALHRFGRSFAEHARRPTVGPGDEPLGRPADGPVGGANDPPSGPAPRAVGAPLPAAPAGLPDGPVSEREAKRLLSAAGIPVVEEDLARTADDAARIAAAFGKPVAVKLCAPGVLHKTEIGAVVLNVATEDGVRDAYETVTSRARAADPAAPIEGALIAPMVSGGIETILGVRNDPTFGPVVMFGLGGTLVEVIDDVSFRVAPFDEAEARRMIAETRAGKVLRGVRGRGPYDVPAVASALARLSAFAAAHGDRIESAEINPFVVLQEGQGAIALDAVILRRSFDS